MAENFRDADDGEIFGVDDRVASGGPHAVPAHAEKIEPTVRVLRLLLVGGAQSFNELCPIPFARSFAG